MLSSHETVENGYVSLRNLVPPGCSPVIASSFCASDEPESGLNVRLLHPLL
jgi:hypothetical protein